LRSCGRRERCVGSPLPATRLPAVRLPMAHLSTACSRRARLPTAHLPAARPKAGRALTTPENYPRAYRSASPAILVVRLAPLRLALPTRRATTVMGLLARHALRTGHALRTRRSLHMRRGLPTPSGRGAPAAAERRLPTAIGLARLARRSVGAWSLRRVGFRPHLIELVWLRAASWFVATGSTGRRAATHTRPTTHRRAARTGWPAVVCHGYVR